MAGHCTGTRNENEHLPPTHRAESLVVLLPKHWEATDTMDTRALMPMGVTGVPRTLPPDTDSKGLGWALGTCPSNWRPR